MKFEHLSVAHLALLGHIFSHLTEKGYSLNLVGTHEVDVGGACIGYYDSEKKAITVAMQNPEAYETFVHEYCHFVQDQNGFLKPLIKSCDKFDEWLAGKLNLKSNTLQSVTNDVMLLERDCEERVVNLMDAFKINYDRSQYIKKANSYVYSYEAIRQTRKWKPSGSTSTVSLYDPDMLALVPDQFLSLGEYFKLPPGYLEKFKKWAS